MPGHWHSQPTLTLLGQGCMRLGVTCYLHFWQNDQGLLHATAVRQGWNGHQVRVSTQSWLCKRTFSCRSCWDSNSQPFNNEPSALTNKLSLLPGHMYKHQISPLIAFIFYPPFKLKKSACMKRVLDYPVGLNAYKLIHFFFSTFNQSCTCSTDANAEKELNF